MADIKWSHFPSATPGNSDEVVGLHSGDNARFSIANIVAAVRNGLANIFVPKTDVGVADGVASLDSTGKVPTSQLPSSTGPEPATATPLMDGTGAVGVSTKYAREDHEHPADTNKQAKITANGILKGDGQGGISAAVAGTDYQAPLTAGTDYATPAQLADKANQSQLAYVETGTTASRNYTAGQYIALNGLLYTADTAIASGATFYTSGGNKNLTECAGGGLNNLFSVLGNIRIKIVSIQNNKQSATLNGAHGIDTNVNTIVFCSRYPSSNQKWMMDQCTVTYYTQDVTITKPAASYGGNNDIYYVLVAYLPTSLL